MVNKKRLRKAIKRGGTKEEIRKLMLEYKDIVESPKAIDFIADFRAIIQKHHLNLMEMHGLTLACLHDAATTSGITEDGWLFKMGHFVTSAHFTTLFTKKPDITMVSPCND